MGVGSLPPQHSSVPFLIDLLRKHMVAPVISPGNEETGLY